MNPISRLTTTAATVAAVLAFGATPATAATNITADCTSVHGSAAAFVEDVSVYANGKLVAQFTHEAPPTGGDWWPFSKPLDLHGDITLQITDTIARGDTYEVLTTTLSCPAPATTTGPTTTTVPPTTTASPTTTTMPAPTTDVEPTATTPAVVDSTIELPPPPTIPAPDTGRITTSTLAARVDQATTTTTLFTFEGHDDFGWATPTSTSTTSSSTTTLAEPVGCCTDYTDTTAPRPAPGRLAITGPAVLPIAAIGAVLLGVGIALRRCRRR